MNPADRYRERPCVTERYVRGRSGYAISAQRPLSQTAESLAWLLSTQTSSMATISEIMTRDVLTLSPFATTDEAAGYFAVHGISGAPVRDAAGRIVGVVSKTDLIDPERAGAFAAEGKRGARLVRDVMTPGIFAIREGEKVMKAIDLMVREGIHRLLVTDEAGLLAGIVTPTDVLRGLLQGHSFESANDAPAVYEQHGAYEHRESSGEPPPLQ